MSVHISPATTPSHMQLETRCAAPGTVIVTVAGEVDMATAPALYTALVTALSDHAPTVIDIDLSACTFLDCSGIRALVSARATATAGSCQMWARNPQRLVRRVLEVTGLLDVLTAPDEATTRNVDGEDATGPASLPIKKQVDASAMVAV